MYLKIWIAIVYSGLFGMINSHTCRRLSFNFDLTQLVLLSIFSKPAMCQTQLSTYCMIDSQHKTFCIIGCGRAKSCVVSGFMKRSSFYTRHICMHYIWDGHMTTHSLNSGRSLLWQYSRYSKESLEQTTFSYMLRCMDLH